ncbi:RING-H2 finger protein ATL58-like isoform X3 [Canna indica]|uniref:RING-H2 finger protein ATL58-like isoform X3 n=1 Tax=Canna indica TaxID=4628 RepID=A0AAQ3Q418_9LILI|nr:RING-H2 finger protein ATL58-like isoform X3 [Canna indica]
MSCGSSDLPTYCSVDSPELKLYQAFIFSVAVFFTFVLLLLFYMSYMRQRRGALADAEVEGRPVELRRSAENVDVLLGIMHVKLRLHCNSNACCVLEFFLISLPPNESL